MDIISILSGILPFSQLIALVIAILFLVRYWKQVKELIKDVWEVGGQALDNVYMSRKVSPLVQSSLISSREREPLLRAFKYVSLIILRVERNAKELKIIRYPGKIVAVIPSRSMDNVVKALHEHLRQNMSILSVVNDYGNIERVLELLYLEFLTKNTGLDGALRIATSRYIHQAKQNEGFREIWETLTELNDELKQSETFLERRLLRILIVETCRSELNAMGKMPI